MSYINEHREVVASNPLKPLYIGTFEKKIQIGNRTRRYLVYIPEDTRPSTAGLFILPANGKTADDVIAHTFWKYVADSEESKEKLILFVLEPADGKWEVTENYGEDAGDVAYVNQVYLEACQRFQFCVHESKFYITGCKEGGVIAQKEVMYNPAVWAGISTVGAAYVQSDYAEAASKDYCLVLDGFEDPEHRLQIRKGDIPVPAWIIKDPGCESQDAQTDMTNYWMHSCGITESGHLIEPEIKEYTRTEAVPYSPNQEKEAFRVWESEMKGSANKWGTSLSRKIWKGFLYHQRRWMSSPGGDLRVTKDPVFDLEMEYHNEVIGGWLREWYVYVPKLVRENPLESVPLVFAMHGYTCSGEIYAGNSEWYKVADQYGFIVVHPTAVPGTTNTKTIASDPDNMPLPAWNFMHDLKDGPDEIAFFRTLIESVSADHKIDRTRIFATGHSHGSLMTQYLALMAGDLFAAVAPCSGVLSMAGYDLSKVPEVQNRTKRKIPIWMFGGEMEEWLLPHFPTNDNATGESIKVWRENNNILPGIPEDWDDNWTVKGRWHDYICTDPEKVPMVRFTWVEYMPHATMTEMSFRIWEEFFSKFARIDGEIVYQP